MRLLRLLISVLVIGVLVYVAVAVPLGRKTLWQHLRAIAGTRESQELVEEVKQKAGKMLKRDAGPGSGTSAGSGRGDDLTEAERQALRKLIKDKLDKPPAEKP